MKKYDKDSPEFALQTHDDWLTKADALIEQLGMHGFQIVRTPDVPPPGDDVRHNAVMNALEELQRRVDYIGTRFYGQGYVDNNGTKFLRDDTRRGE